MSDLLLQFFIGLVVGLIISGLFDAILYFIPKFRKKYWHSHPKFFSYHFHHSLFGLFFIGVSLFTSVLFTGVGIGIIIVHTITDKRGLVFIEKS
jgi:hypothetical protein